MALPLAILLIPRPAGIAPQAWLLLAIFAGTILGVIVQPLPIAAVALIGIVTATFTGAMTPAQALGGYADPLVWMVFAAFCIAGTMIKTGLGRRLALLFIRSVGGTSIGLAYSLIGSDVVLGTVIPSNGARAAGIIFPVVKSLAQTFDSKPGPTASRLGAFLMLAVYHCDMTVSAMFFTGQASNPLIAQLARQVTGIEIGYTQWAVGAIAPAAVSMLAIPFLLLWLTPPDIRRTPAATQFASAELARLGPPTASEKIMLGVFVLLMALWMTRSWHGIDYPIVALAGLGILLVARVLEWTDVLNERSAWDTFVWYGALVQMARGTWRHGHHQDIRTVHVHTDRRVRLGDCAHRTGCGLRLRTLRLRKHHGACLRDVRAVPHRRAGCGHAGVSCSALAGLSLQRGRLADAVRHDARPRGTSGPAM